MKCPRYRTELADGDRFCSACGCPRPRPVSPFRKAVSSIAKAVAYVLLFLCSQSAVSGIYSAALTTQILFGAGGALTEAELYDQVLTALYENLTLINLISGLLTLLVLVIFFAVRHKNMFAEIRLRPVKFSTLLWAALAGVAFNIFISITISLLPLPEAWFAGLENQYSYIGEGSNLLLDIFTTTILTGFLEETIFRGLVDSRLRAGLPTGIAIVLSAAIFGLCHGTPIAIGYAFVIGLVFSLLFLRRGSILPSIVCHMCFNLTSYLFMPNDPVFLLGLYLVSAGTLLFAFYHLFAAESTSDTARKYADVSV